MYIVVIGDMVNSKKYSKNIRREVQDSLEKTLVAVNNHFENEIVSNFIITTGDEFQAILKSSAPFVKMIEYIRNRLFYFDEENKKRFVSIRFGIGYGAIHTDEQKIVKEYSIGNDGQVFWNARRAIEHIHTENDYGVTNISFDSRMKENELDIKTVFNDQLINHLLRMHELIRNNWTNAQKEYVASVSELIENTSSKYTHLEIAKWLEITPQYVSNRMKQTGFYQFVSNINWIEKIVARGGRESDQ